MKDLEHVCRLLAAWSGPGSSWLAKVVVEAATPERPKVGFGLSWRGGVEEQATKGVRRMRSWVRAQGVVAQPMREPQAEISVTLAWIGPQHADVLLAFACEDAEAWRRYRARLGCSPVLADHAMASLMRPAKRCRVAGNELARSLGMRAGVYFAERRRIEDLLSQALQDAAAEFMRMLGGKSKYPENDMVNRGSQYRPARHKTQTPWWRPEGASAVLALQGREAERHCQMQPAQSRLLPERIDPTEARRVVVPVQESRTRGPALVACTPPEPVHLPNGFALAADDWFWCRGPEFEFESVLARAA